jgi:hypothetical protein
MAAMEALTTTLLADGLDSGFDVRGHRRAERFARVKFVGLPAESATDPLGPAARRDPPVDGPRAGARLLRLLRRFVSRVIGRPSAARP